MKKNILIGFIFILLYCLACKREHVHDTDNLSLTIKINKPTPNQIFNNPTTIDFDFEATYNNEIHGYEFRILRFPAKNQLKIQNEHLHGKNFQRNYIWNTDTFTGNFQFELKVLSDHEGNYKMDTVNFEIKR